MAGKGDGYRPVDREKFSSNWDAIFGKKDRASVSVPSTEGLRETLDRQTEKTADRCDKTVDIEELIDASKDAEK